MSARSGRLARVLYGGNTITGLSRWNLSGYKVAFGRAGGMGDTVQKFERVDSDDPGMVSFEGNYDPDDTNGQTAINALKTITSGLTNLYFYEVYDVSGSDFVFWRVGSDGDIKIETFDAVDMPKNGMGRITFSGRVSGAAMERVSAAIEYYIYVTDTAPDNVRKFDSDGVLSLTWGSSGTGDGQFDWPFGVAVDVSGNVYVADTHNDRIQKFDSDGVFQAILGSSGTGDGQFDWPYGVAVDASGNVYVADTYNNRIQKFDSDGVFQAILGSSGTGDGQFNRPVGVAIDSSSNVYVADRNNNRIQKFDSDGVYITKWGSYGTGDGQFDWPYGVFVDNGNVYVADTYNNRIQKFDSDGVYQTKWGSEGSEDGEFSYPRGVAVDSSGNVYVVDSGNHRIQKFDSDGVYLSQFDISETAVSYGIAVG